MRKYIIYFVVLFIFTSYSCSKNNKLIQLTPRYETEIQSITKDWSTISINSDETIKEIFSNAIVLNDFTKTYNGPHSGTALIDKKNKIIATVDSLRINSMLIIFLSEEIDADRIIIKDCMIYHLTDIQKVLYTSGKYKDEYLPHIIVVTSFLSNDETLSIFDKCFWFDINRMKIVELVNEDLIIYNEEG